MGGFKKDGCTALSEIFHGPLAVHLSNDDITVTRMGTALDEEQITRQDAGIDHGMPVHLEKVRGFLVPDEIRIERQGIGQFLVSR